VWPTDIAGLSRRQAVEVMRWSARSLLQAMLAKHDGTASPVSDQFRIRDDDLAVVVDAPGVGDRPAGRVDGGEAAPRSQRRRVARTVVRMLGFSVLRGSVCRLSQRRPMRIDPATLPGSAVGP
jgi:hypothetical protein